jgi:cobalt/nickel transport system permease protein
MTIQLPLLMHIPDGYLSPATCAVLYALAIPFLVVASSQVRKTVGGRSVPLLAVFSAFSFAIMMFNVPVPGGTTAHAAGGTLIAIVLGPWAAVIATSVALVLQALFFGDGGVTAIGANVFNMGVVLPVAGYAVYRLVAGRSEMMSQRRVVAAAVGSYVGITVAALLVGVELGLQPHLWSTNGVPDYSPYGFSTAIPSMMLSHMAGASFVEAAVTAMGVAYLQKSFPEVLLRRRPRGTEPSERGAQLNPWIPVAGLTAVAAVAVFLAGLVRSGGSLADWANLDWSSVNWRDAGLTVLVSGVLSAIVLPLLYLGLRGRPGVRGAVLVLAGLMIWAPIGLIAPGGAFGEDTSATPAEVAAAVQARDAGDATLFDALPDVNKECACVPNKINNVTFANRTLLSGYELPFIGANAPAWKQNVGYQAAGLAGVAALAVVGLALVALVRWLLPEAPPDWRTA